MRPLLAACVLVWLAPLLAHAQTPIVINGKHRTPNRPQGCCGYSTLETVARHQGYTQLDGTTAARAALPYGPTRHDPVCGPVRAHPCGSWLHNLTRLLDAKGVKYEYRPHGSYDESLFRKGLASGRPVLFSTRGGHQCQAGHWWAMVGRTKDGAVLAHDTNYTGEAYRTLPGDWFRARWDGSSLLLAERKAVRR